MTPFFRFTLYITCAFITLFITPGCAQNERPELYPTDSIVSRYHNDWTQGHYRERIAVFMEQPLDSAEIVFVGNSITEQGKDWSEKFGTEHVRNRGIAGDVTDGVLKRLAEITHYKPKAVFILIGVNDLFSLHHDADNRHDLKYDLIVPSVEYVADNIMQIVREIRRESAYTIVHVCTVLPTTRAYLKEDIEKLNKLISKNEAKGSYTVIDLYSEFVDKDGYMKKEYTTDGVHLNEAGYQHWVEYEKPFIELYK